MFNVPRYKHMTTSSDDGVVYANVCRLYTVVVGTVGVTGATLKLYDVTTEAAATNSNQIATIALDGRESYDFAGARLDNGLVGVISTSGTNDVTVMFG